MWAYMKKEIIAKLVIKTEKKKLIKKRLLNNQCQ